MQKYNDHFSNYIFKYIALYICPARLLLCIVCMHCIACKCMVSSRLKMKYVFNRKKASYYSKKEPTLLV